MSQLDACVIRAAVDHIDLGRLDTSPRLVHRGLHSSYLVSTTRGHWLLKVLDRSVLAEAGAGRRMVLGEALARACSRQGIPAAVAMRCRSGPLHRCESGAAYMLWRFHPGSPVSGTAVTPGHAATLGRLLARMHAVGRRRMPRGGGRSGAPWQPPTASGWQVIIEAARTSDPGLAADLAAHRGLLAAAAESYRHGVAMLSGETVLGHGDLAPANVLWWSGTPLIIDWELAGGIDPAAELFNCAVDWAERSACAGEALVAMAEAYGRTAGVPATPLAVAYRARAGRLLAFVAFSARRASRDDNPQRQADIDQVRDTLVRLDAFMASGSRWAAAMDAALRHPHPVAIAGSPCAGPA